MMEYCERIGDGFWAEPVNALTNAAFVIAALLLFRLLGQQRQPVPWDVYLLPLLIACVGLGSFLWHTLATPWSELADKLPIFAFMFVYLQSYMARVLDLSRLGVSVWLVLFLLLNVAVMLWLPADLLNGSVMYLPALLALLLLTLTSVLRRLGGAMIMLAVAGLFCVSVTFRSIDQQLCDLFPLGTHFAWHLLNAIMLYWLMRVLIGSTLNAQERSALA
jgi:hypothetical protein